MARRHRSAHGPNISAEQVASLLRNELGGHLPGARLPGRAVLAGYFGVSEYTIRKALGRLAEEGLVEQQTAGVMVLPAARGRPMLREIVVLLDRSRSHLYEQGMVLGVELIARRNGLDFRVAWADQLPETIQQLRVIADRGIHEIGWVLCSFWPQAAVLLQWQTAGLNFVLMENEPENVRVNVVAQDVGGAVFQATSLLLKLGHRRIACACRGREPNPISAARLRGYQLAMTANRAPVDESLTIAGWEAHAETELSELLARPLEQRPTAVLCGNQNLGCLVLDVLDKLRLAVPGQISVISTGMHPYPEPAGLSRLTRFDEGPAQRLGQLAAELLLTASDHNGPRTICPGFSYLDRGSVASPPQ